MPDGQTGAGCASLTPPARASCDRAVAQLVLINSFAVDIVWRPAPAADEPGMPTPLPELTGDALTMELERRRASFDMRFDALFAPKDGDKSARHGSPAAAARGSVAVVHDEDAMPSAALHAAGAEVTRPPRVPCARPCPSQRHSRWSASPLAT